MPKAGSKSIRELLAEAPPLTDEQQSLLNAAVANAMTGSELCHCLELSVGSCTVLVNDGATLEWVLGATREELLKVPGIGATRADEILLGVSNFKLRAPVQALDACLRCINAMDALKEAVEKSLEEMGNKFDDARNMALREAQRMQAIIHSDAKLKAEIFPDGGETA